MPRNHCPPTGQRRLRPERSSSSYQRSSTRSSASPPPSTRTRERASGGVAFVVCRFEPKDFRPAQLRGDRWRWNLEAAPVIPYRLPELEQALSAGETVWIVDGEKDADTIAAAGATATCCARSQGWTVELAEQLTGARRVRIVADRDGGTGERQARGLAKLLVDVAAIASSDVELVQAAEGKDAHDHLAAGRGLSEFEPLEELVETVSHVNGSFDERVRSRRVDLIARIRDGIPPAEYLPASQHMLRRGKRHHWAAPKKVGKSFGGQVHAVDIVLAGGHVVIFDRENGGDLYASRLEAIVAARDLDDVQQATVAAELDYFEFPRFRRDDRRDLVELCAGADLVVFDSQRMYLSDLGLEENSSDDYAEFMASLIDPLFAAGIATLILDNTGHQETKRGRGASSKGDLNEILFALETVEKFNLEATGRLRIEITDSRFGNAGRWEMEIGGGVFSSWRRVDRPDELAASAFRPTGKMERASIFVENCSEPVSRTTVTDAIGGNAKYARIAIETLVREHFFRSIDGPRGAKLVESLRLYREATDTVPQATEGADPVSTASRLDSPDPVPTPSDAESLNHAESATPSDPVPTASTTASDDRVPTGGFPYGEPTARDGVTQAPRPSLDEAEVERLAAIARAELDAVDDDLFS